MDARATKKESHNDEEKNDELNDLHCGNTSKVATRATKEEHQNDEEKNDISFANMMPGVKDILAGKSATWNELEEIREGHCQKAATAGGTPPCGNRQFAMWEWMGMWEWMVLQLRLQTLQVQVLVQALLQ